MDLGSWLRSLGLAQYERSTTRPAEPDGEDLKDLGVSIVGHRRKLLDANAALHADTEPKTAPVAPTSPPSQLSQPRLPASVVSDLVDSTGSAARLDAEEWRDLANACLDDASAAVIEMGGNVAKKLGDGLMAHFGYLLAQENDAERAARSALSIQRALADLNRKNAGARNPELVARIGLETGQAMVDVAGEIYGDVTSIAARVQVQAPPE